MPDGPAGAAKGAANAAGKGLTRKVGPLPVWGWAILVVGAGGVVYWVFLGPSAGSSGGSSTPGMPLPGNIGGGGSGGAPSPPPGEPKPPGTGGGGTTPKPADPVPPVVVKLTNTQWLDQGVNAAVQRLGVSAAQARLYLSQYLAGGGPIGNTSALSAFERVIRTAVEAVGEAPYGTATPNPNANAFNSNATWFQNARAFLGNVPGGVLLELSALFAGTTTTISQAAADALENARGVIGVEPTNTPYTITKVGGPAAVFTATVEQAKRLLDLATAAQKGGANLNSSGAYLPIYRSAFPGLADEVLQAIHDQMRQLYYNGIIPDAEQVRQIVQGTIASGRRDVVPVNAPVPEATPAPAVGGGGLASTLGAGWRLIEGGNWAIGPAGQRIVPPWVDLGSGLGVSPG